jgi:hypothetical protein
MSGTSVREAHVVITRARTSDPSVADYVDGAGGLSSHNSGRPFGGPLADAGDLHFRSMVRYRPSIQTPGAGKPLGKKGMPMSRARRLSHVATIGLITGLLWIAFLHPAHAALGDFLPGTPVTIANAAQCSVPGTAIALVQGSKVKPSFPTVPVLLVTNCPDSPGVLRFLDTTGAQVATITTPLGSFVPPAGWGAFAVRGDKGDLLACANRNPADQHLIYTIDYNGLNNIDDGTTSAQPLVAVPANGVDACDGLAWDQSTDSIYKTNKAVQPDLSIAITSISRFDKNGAPLGTLPGFNPTGCGDGGGITLAGGGLLLNCHGDLQIRHLDKLTGAESTNPPLTPFTPDDAAATDVECDPVTYASGPNASMHKDALWKKTKNGSNQDQLVAIELPGGTCGFHDGPLVFAPGACLASGGGQDLTNVLDTDGDGLLDCWEESGAGTFWATHPPFDGKPGIDFDGDGVRDLILCDTANCASAELPSKTRKDVFVEIDYMTNHLPDAAARSNVVSAFNGAPGGGVKLHLQLGEDVGHTNAIALEPCTAAAVAGVTDFEQLKRDKFGTPAERTQGLKTLYAKRLAFHYAVFAHKLVGDLPNTTSNSSGCSHIGGSDVVITLGSFASTLVANVIHNRGTTDQQAGTLMHELGHNLGFRHGGSDNVNCKPNYLSVMNYSRQFSNIIAGRRLDYSRNGLGTGAITLDEAGLNETLGIGGPGLPANEKTAFGLITGLAKVVSVSDANGNKLPVDWNQVGGAVDTVSGFDINRIDPAGCDGAGSIMVPFNDWANAQFNLRASLEFAGGADTEQTDTTAEQEADGFALVDEDQNGIFDGFQCGNPPNVDAAECLMDVKAGDPLNISNLVSPLQGVLPAAILSTPTFDASTRVDPESLTLDGHPVQRNNQGKVQCSTGDVSGPAGTKDGLKDLNCKFDGVSFPTPGSYFVVLKGKLFPQFGGWQIQARDIVNVKP